MGAGFSTPAPLTAPAPQAVRMTNAVRFWKLVVTGQQRGDAAYHVAALDLAKRAGGPLALENVCRVALPLTDRVVQLPERVFAATVVGADGTCRAFVDAERAEYARATTTSATTAVSATAPRRPSVATAGAAVSAAAAAAVSSSPGASLKTIGSAGRGASAGDTDLPLYTAWHIVCQSVCYQLPTQLRQPDGRDAIDTASLAREMLSFFLLSAAAWAAVDHDALPDGTPLSTAPAAVAARAPALRTAQHALLHDPVARVVGSRVSGALMMAHRSPFAPNPNEDDQDPALVAARSGAWGVAAALGPEPPLHVAVSRARCIAKALLALRSGSSDGSSPSSSAPATAERGATQPPPPALWTALGIVGAPSASASAPAPTAAAAACASGPGGCVFPLCDGVGLDVALRGCDGRTAVHRAVDVHDVSTAIDIASQLWATDADALGRAYTLNGDTLLMSAVTTDALAVALITRPPIHVTTYACLLATDRHGRTALSRVLERIAAAKATHTQGPSRAQQAAGAGAGGAAAAGPVAGPWAAAAHDIVLRQFEAQRDALRALEGDAAAFGARAVALVSACCFGDGGSRAFVPLATLCCAYVMFL